MNNNKKVITLILVVTIIHLLLSIFSKKFIDYYPNFKNVNLIGDILQKEKTIQKKKFHKTEFAQSAPHQYILTQIRKSK